MADVGVLLPDGASTTPDLGFGHLTDLAVAAEAAGFSAVWVPDRCPDQPHPGAHRPPALEAYTLLGALAVRTSSVQLGALVSDVTCRHPSLLAKMTTTLDLITGGRAVLGLGIPGQRPVQAVHYEWLDEAIRICRAMFTAEEVSFTGRHFRLDRARNLPRPARPGGPKILVGGDDDDGRLLPLVAGGADMYTVTGDTGAVARTVATLRRLCERIGRDPAGIEVAWLARYDPAGPVERIPELVDEHVAAGADSVILSMGSVGTASIDAVGRALDLAAP